MTSSGSPAARPRRHADEPHDTAVQRFVMPAREASASLPLYADARDADAVTPLGHGSARLTRPGRVSFASYFNAFPAGYWQHWTTARSARLTIRFDGPAAVTLMRSDATGAARAVGEFPADADHRVDAVVELDDGFALGGWCWFEVACDAPVTLVEGAWHVDAAVATPGLLTLGITTLDKPDFCIANLAALAADPELVAELDAVVIVDQGRRLVRDEPGFAAAEAALGGKLHVIRQPNLGGSGGFSRIMAEALDRADSDFVMLLDDDVEVETDGILRALAFARRSTSPTIVGGHMLDLNDRAVLHAYSEIVDPDTFMWGPPDRAHERHDFAAEPLDSPRSAWLHRREDGDFNGWWMCLIPLETVRAIGLSMPFFIKWDDAEYGLRARAAGFPTVSLPGSALWHVSWVDKDDTLNWQAYYHARNRTVAALLHSSRPHGGALLAESGKQDVKQLLSMQYYAVELRHRALRDVLAGPERLRETLATELPVLRRLASGFGEMRLWGEDAPAAREGRPDWPATDGRGPRGARLALFTLRAAARHWFTKPDPANVERPQLAAAKRDATWWRLPRLDSALVDAADGSGANWYIRDRAQFRARLRESRRLHRALATQWDALARRYREAMPALVSPASWRASFHAGDADEAVTAPER